MPARLTTYQRKRLMSQIQWQQQLQQWQQLEEEEQARQLHNAAVLDGVIYALCIVVGIFILFGGLQ